jgi:CHAT domain
MTIREYRDFVLVADDVAQETDGGLRKVSINVFDSPVGQGEQKEKVMVPDALSKMVRWLDTRKLDENLEQQIELGESLASVLLPPHARRLFAESLARLRSDEGLRLRLRLDHPLANLPWEYTYISDSRGGKTANGFLALDPRISIVRHEALAVPGDWFEAPNQRRILVAMASPKPYQKYRKLESLPREQRLIQQALSGVAGVKAVFVPVFQTGGDGEMPGVTIRQLAESLMEPTDVFHFSGHGEFVQGVTSGEGQGTLIFSDAKNEALPVSSETLAELLKSKGVRLIVLGACEGGRRDGQNVWSGVAAALLRVGIPAVVAMQFAIDDKLAATFVAAFYRALVGGSTVDEAVASGRLAIRLEASQGKKDIRDWGVPVLYLRAPGGVVFKPIKDQQAVREAVHQTENLVEQRAREVGTTGRLVGAVIDLLTSEDQITINQKIEQETKGFVLGGRLFTIEGGRFTVKMEADVVSGTMVGVQIGRFGRNQPSDDSDRDAIEQLERLLRSK